MSPHKSSDLSGFPGFFVFEMKKSGIDVILFIGHIQCRYRYQAIKTYCKYFSGGRPFEGLRLVLHVPSVTLEEGFQTNL